LNEEKEKSKKKRDQWGPPHMGKCGIRSRSDAAPVAPGDRLLNWFRETLERMMQQEPDLIHFMTKQFVTIIVTSDCHPMRHVNLL
jgi:hypothetical protein